MICLNCKRDVECELCEPFCICCFNSKDNKPHDANPKRGKSCMFPYDCPNWINQVKSK